MIRRLLLLFAMVFWASVAHAAIGVVQSVSQVPSVNTDVTASFGVTVINGSMIALGLVRVSGAGTFSASDAVNGAYSELLADVDGDIWWFYTRNVTGGFTNVSINGSDDGGTTNYGYLLLEINGADNVASLTSDTNSDVSGTSHTCAGTGLSGTGLFMGVAVSGNLVDSTPGAGWTGDVRDFPNGEPLRLARRRLA